MKVQDEIERLMREVAKLSARCVWLAENREKLSELPDGKIFDGGLDLDNLPHADVIKVVRVLGGKWKKSSNTSQVNQNKIDYVGEFQGVRVRCWAGSPPPSCKIVEIEELVPEQVVPAHTRKVRKMICAPSLEHNIVTAAPKENGVVA